MRESMGIHHSITHIIHSHTSRDITYFVEQFLFFFLNLEKDFCYQYKATSECDRCMKYYGPVLPKSCIFASGTFFTRSSSDRSVCTKTLPPTKHLLTDNIFIRVNVVVVCADPRISTHRYEYMAESEGIAITEPRSACIN